MRINSQTNGTSTLRSSIAPAFLALCCGALLPLTLAPFDWWSLAIPSIGGWLWLLNRWPKRAVLLGFAYGVGKYGLGVSWVYVSMRLYGGASVPLGVFLVGVFVAGLSIFTLAQAKCYVEVCGMAYSRTIFRNLFKRAPLPLDSERNDHSSRKGESLATVVKSQTFGGAWPETDSERDVSVDLGSEGISVAFGAKGESIHGGPEEEPATPIPQTAHGARTEAESERVESIVAGQAEGIRCAKQGGGATLTQSTLGSDCDGPFSRRWILLDAALFTLVWFVFEWLLVWAFTGFPWLFPGYAHLDTPLGNLMPVGGVSLASVGIVLSSGFLVAALAFVRRAGGNIGAQTVNGTRAVAPLDTDVVEGGNAGVQTTDGNGVQTSNPSRSAGDEIRGEQPTDGAGEGSLPVTPPQDRPRETEQTPDGTGEGSMPVTPRQDCLSKAEQTTDDIIERSLRRNGLLIALGLAALPWLVGFALQPFEWVEPGAAHRVALVQGDVDQAIKWRPESRRAIIDRYMAMTAPHWGTDLIVWPEAAVTLFAHQAAEVLESLHESGEQAGSAVVVGIPTAERLPDNGWEIFNSALAIGAGEGRYHKRRLVPFGDYVPFAHWLRGVIDFFDLPMSSFSSGTARQGLLDIGFARAAMGICYEVAYAGLMRQPPADVLLTISNDTWFGKSIGPLQHMQIARARALENGRWLLRGTNNGVTAIVDHRGRVAASLAQFERGVLTGEFHIMEGNTPYGRFGDLWLIVLCFAGLVVGIIYRERLSGRTKARYG